MLLLPYESHVGFLDFLIHRVKKTCVVKSVFLPYLSRPNLLTVKQILQSSKEKQYYVLNLILSESLSH